MKTVTNVYLSSRGLPRPGESPPWFTRAARDGHFPAHTGRLALRVLVGKLPLTPDPFERIKDILQTIPVPSIANPSNGSTPSVQAVTKAWVAEALIRLREALPEDTNIPTVNDEFLAMVDGLIGRLHRPLSRDRSSAVVVPAGNVSVPNFLRFYPRCSWLSSFPGFGCSNRIHGALYRSYMVLFHARV